MSTLQPMMITTEGKAAAGNPPPCAQTRQNAVTEALRQMILSGGIEAGSRIGEAEMARRLGVSRTPVRLALTALEREGLLTALPRRGFRVRRFRLKDILDAFDVRGTLEGMLCRLLAENIPDSARLAALEQTVTRGEEIIIHLPPGSDQARQWFASNDRFHHLLLDAAANRPLAEALHANSRLPLVVVGAVTCNLDQPQLAAELMAAANREHRAILDAIRQGQASRAEALMREHVYQSRESLHRLLGDPARCRRHPGLPGWRLISPDDESQNNGTTT